MKITEQKLRWFYEIGEQVIDFADTYAMAKYKQSGGMYISCFNPHSISFRMEWETGCMGCYDKHDMDFDISFDMLASPNWKEKLQAEIDEARRKAKEKDEADRRRYAKQQQDYEQAEYLRLKQKYER